MALVFHSKDDCPLVRALLADLGIAPGTLDLAMRNAWFRVKRMVSSSHAGDGRAR